MAPGMENRKELALEMSSQDGNNNVSQEGNYE